MRRKRFSPDQIIRMLREAEAFRAGGQTLPEVCKQFGVSLNTYHRWRKEYGDIDVNQAHPSVPQEIWTVLVDKLDYK